MCEIVCKRMNEELGTHFAQFRYTILVWICYPRERKQVLCTKHQKPSTVYLHSAPYLLTGRQDTRFLAGETFCILSPIIISVLWSFIKRGEILLTLVETKCAEKFTGAWQVPRISRVTYKKEKNIISSNVYQVLICSSVLQITVTNITRNSSQVCNVFP